MLVIDRYGLKFGRGLWRRSAVASHDTIGRDPAQLALDRVPGLRGLVFLSHGLQQGGAPAESGLLVRPTQSLGEAGFPLLGRHRGAIPETSSFLGVGICVAFHARAAG